MRDKTLLELVKIACRDHGCSRSDAFYYARRAIEVWKQEDIEDEDLLARCKFFENFNASRRQTVKPGTEVLDGDDRLESSRVEDWRFDSCRGDYFERRREEIRGEKFRAKLAASKSMPENGNHNARTGGFCIIKLEPRTDKTEWPVNKIA